MIYENYLSLIGSTPIIKYNDFYLKLESYNLTGSVKDRPALKIIEDLFESGKVKKGDTIVEATSGNMGISLAIIGALKGLKSVIVMPDTATKERINLLKAYGAKVILTKGALRMKKAIKIARKIALKNGYVYINQFENKNNYIAHYKTAEEIINDFPKLDFFVCGVGSGGSITGISTILKKHYPNIKIIAVEPEESKFLKNDFGCCHKICGLGSDFLPKILDVSLIDRILDISSDETLEKFKEITEKGYNFGISSVAVINACEKIKKENPEKIILGLAPDGINKYMSWFD